MPKVQIPIIVPDDKQFDDFSVSDYTKRQINGIFTMGVDSEGQQKLAWENRPGFSEWIDLGEAAPVDGLFWWNRQQNLVATCNGKTFFIDVSGTVNEKTGTATMVAGVRPTYSDMSGTKIYQASSGQIGGYLAGAGNNGAYITDPQVPTNVTHLATLNKIMIALTANSEKFEWSVVNNAESWDADFASAETETDLALGLYVNNSEIAIPGQNSFEIWRDTGTTFVRELQGYVQTGIIAPDSFAVINNEYFWLTQNREVVRLTGRKQKIISAPYARFLKSLGTVDDAKGSFLKVGGKNFYILDFPTEGRTLIFDVEVDMWCEWGDFTAPGYANFLGNCFVECPTWGTTVMGSRAADGKIYIISPDYLTDAGYSIRGMVRTDVRDHGVPRQRKFCSELTFTFKRSEASGDGGGLLINGEQLLVGGEEITFEDGAEAVVFVRFRDDGKKEWSDSIQVTVEDTGTTDFVATVRRLGSYMTRQYEFAFATATDIILMKVEEEVS